MIRPGGLVSHVRELEGYGSHHNGSRSQSVGDVCDGFFESSLRRIGVIPKIDMGMIGRMAVGWTQGRFMYRHPDEMECVPNEMVYGYFTHYAIGVGFAVPFVLGWDLLVGGPASPIWAFVYGVATTVASLFFVYPSMGFGMFGRRSPEGIKSLLSSLANHVFFGVGMAVAVALM